MEMKRFDRLTRSLASGPSRRVILVWMATSLSALLPPGDAARAKRKRKKKKKKPAVVPPVSPPAPPPPGCTPTCANRVCGPDSCGGGSCGDCGVCKTCEGGACFPKTNGTGCVGECLECQGGACVAKTKGTPCTGGVCAGTVCCPSGADRICGTLCCPAGTLCIDTDNGRCAPVCDAACIARGPRCGCALTFDTELDYCNVNPDSGVICAQPDCDSQEDCAPDKVCSNFSCGATTFHKCLDACPA